MIRRDREKEGNRERENCAWCHGLYIYLTNNSCENVRQLCQFSLEHSEQMLKFVNLGIWMRTSRDLFGLDWNPRSVFTWPTCYYIFRVYVMAVLTYLAMTSDSNSMESILVLTIIFLPHNIITIWCNVCYYNNENQQHLYI